MSHGVLCTPPAGWGGPCWQGGGQYWAWEYGRWQWKCEGQYVPAWLARREVVLVSLCPRQAHSWG